MLFNYMKKYFCLVSLLSFTSLSGSSQAQSVTNPTLIKALETYIVKQGANPKKTQYRIAEIDLNGDKKKMLLSCFKIAIGAVVVVAQC